MKVIWWCARFSSLLRSCERVVIRLRRIRDCRVHFRRVVVNISQIDLSTGVLSHQYSVSVAITRNANARLTSDTICISASVSFGLPIVGVFAPPEPQFLLPLCLLSAVAGPMSNISDALSLRGLTGGGMYTHKNFRSSLANEVRCIHFITSLNISAKFWCVCPDW